MALRRRQLHNGSGEMAHSRPQAIATLQIDNDRVKVTQWRFPPGAETGWHRHAMDYVVVPIADGPLLLEQPDGTTVPASLVTGRSYTRPTGVEHNVINASDHEIAFIEIELK
jgi:quercetin dioxygenase-like cupin family protein